MATRAGREEGATIAASSCSCSSRRVRHRSIRGASELAPDAAVSSKGTGGDAEAAPKVDCLDSCGEGDAMARASPTDLRPTLAGELLEVELGTEPVRTPVTTAAPPPPLPPLPLTPTAPALATPGLAPASGLPTAGVVLARELLDSVRPRGWGVAVPGGGTCPGGVPAPTGTPRTGVPTKRRGAGVEAAGVGVGTGLGAELPTLGGRTGSCCRSMWHRLAAAVSWVRSLVEVTASTRWWTMAWCAPVLGRDTGTASTSPRPRGTHGSCSTLPRSRPRSLRRDAAFWDANHGSAANIVPGPAPAPVPRPRPLAARRRLANTLDVLPLLLLPPLSTTTTGRVSTDRERRGREGMGPATTPRVPTCTLLAA